jgi:multidrug resistance efflux pump
VAELDNSALTQGLEQKHIAALEAETTWRNTDDLAGISLADKQNELRQRELELEKAQLAASVPTDLMSAHDAQQKQLELHRAETAVEKAKRDLEAERDSDELERHVKTLERDRTKTAVDTVEKTIADLVLRAPKDGVVVLGDQPWEGRKFQVGDTAWNGLTIASMPDLAQALEVHAELSDVDDGRLAVGMTGTCTLDAYPADAVPCTVRDVTPVAREVSKNSVRHAFAVVLELAHADTAHQRPGLSVKVELARPAVTGVVVPRGAVVFGSPVHVTMASGEPREVTLAGCGAQACAIASGVRDGEAVRP